MSFIAKNPLSATKLEVSPPSPFEGTRGLYPKEDGWYDINSDGEERKVAYIEDVSNNVVLNNVTNNTALGENSISSGTSTIPYSDVVLPTTIYWAPIDDTIFEVVDGVTCYDFSNIKFSSTETTYGVVETIYKYYEEHGFYRYTLFQNYAPDLEPGTTVDVCSIDDPIWLAIKTEILKDNGVLFNLANGESSFVGGIDNVALNNGDACFGKNNISSGKYSFAAGRDNISRGEAATALGAENKSLGFACLTVGRENVAGGEDSVALGSRCKAIGKYSFAFGSRAIAGGSGNTFSIGMNTVVNGVASFGMGKDCKVLGAQSFGGGVSNNVNGDFCFAFGRSNTTNERDNVAIGIGNVVNGTASFSGGSGNTTSGIYNVAFGSKNTIKDGTGCFVSGNENTVSNSIWSAISAGYKNSIVGNYGFATGYFNSIAGDYGFAAGYSNSIEGKGIFAGGYDNLIKKQYSAAFGYCNEVNSSASFAAGSMNKINGVYNVAFGVNNLIEKGTACFVSGTENRIVGSGSFCLISGYGLEASGTQAVLGKYNEAIKDAVLILGNGSDVNNRSNALVVKNTGDVETIGNIAAKSVILNSSTAGSTKKFIITVDDEGNLSAEEI